MQPRYLSLGEACEQLNIPPRTFRQLMADFSDVIEPPRPSADGQVQELADTEVERLRQILELRQRGIATADIVEILQAGTEARLQPALSEVAATIEGDLTETDESVDEAIVDELVVRQTALVNTLERLTGELSRSEERRIDERDRLLTTLMRTQREIQQLRYEVAAHLTRRGRKRGSWLKRLFK